ncbi:hypothetical protein BU14_0438s0021 [Porphyra umbilicalis]|uniref:Uncharacterized protein n=1 Tax=Porphyra umbilicalis TaxID=2786 RepID=A0A1X6NV87_PORUM|nr:hypothetical protein BU14_0438s0021 [Porphyra umbilicalis]|eukprot:OSX72426.1 hypothetical protein BU14_0438s0021 [Porphyra umbilicalis]
MASPPMARGAVCCHIRYFFSGVIAVLQSWDSQVCFVHPARSSFGVGTAVCLLKRADSSPDEPSLRRRASSGDRQVSNTA